MMPYEVGRWLTRAYYKASPTVVAWFEAHPWLKVPARLLLWLAIGVAWLIQASWKVQLAVGVSAAGLTMAFKLGMGSWLWSINLVRGLLAIAGLALASALFASSQAQAGDLLFFHNDHQGTAQVITDESQTVVWQGEQQPFGEVTTSVSSQENPTRLPGQYYDGESGLHYNMMRDYDPTLGRYVQSDPIGLQGGVNTYAYAVGNPITYADPTGEFFALLNPYTMVGLTGFVVLMQGYMDFVTAVNSLRYLWILCFIGLHWHY